MLSHIIGIDDAPFDRTHRGDVLVVGAVFTGVRLEGVLTTKVRRDGANAADRVTAMIARSKFAPQIQLVMLQGVALAGFNVVDVPRLSEQLVVPVLIVARRRPRYDAVRDALHRRVRGGARKWHLIEALGPMENVGGVYVQRLGLTRSETERVIRRTAVHGTIPEPLRTAHLIAGALARGVSRGRT